MSDPNPLSRPGYFPPPPAYVTQSRPIPRWIWFVAGGFLMLVAGLSIPIVHLVRTVRNTAHTNVDELHAEMRRGDVQAIFDSSDPSWQKQVGLAKTQHLFSFVHDKLGDPVSSSLRGWNMSDDAQGAIVTYTFSTTFSKGGATETVTMHKAGGTWRLWQYNVKSTLIAPGEYKD